MLEADARKTLACNNRKASDRMAASEGETTMGRLGGRTGRRQPEPISPEPEEMPPLAPPSAEVGCTPKTPSPPPKAPTATSGKGRRWVALPSEPPAEAGRPPERPEPRLDSHQWEAMKAVIAAKNEELSYKENIIENMGQELKEKDQELEDKEKRIKNMIQELRLKNASIRASNEEFEEQQAQVKVWEQEVTIGDDMAIGVVVRKKRKITGATS